MKILFLTKMKILFLIVKTTQRTEIQLAIIMLGLDIATPKKIS